MEGAPLTHGLCPQGWIQQNCIPTEYNQQPLGSSRTNRSLSSCGSGQSRGSRASSRSAGGKRRKELHSLIYRVKNLELEIEDVKSGREEVEMELQRTRSSMGGGLPPRMPTGRTSRRK